MKKILKNFIVLSLMAFILLPTISLAQTGKNIITKPTDPSVRFGTANELLDVVGAIAKYIYFALFAVAVIFLLMAAFSYLGSGGDPGKVKKASAQLIYAVVAIVVGIVAFSITTIIDKIVA